MLFQFCLTAITPIDLRCASATSPLKGEDNTHTHPLTPPQDGVHLSACAMVPDLRRDERGIVMQSYEIDWSAVAAIELGVASVDHKKQIGKEHLYTVAQRILSKGYQQLEIDISRYKNDKN